MSKPDIAAALSQGDAWDGDRVASLLSSEVVSGAVSQLKILEPQQKLRLLVALALMQPRQRQAVTPEAVAALLDAAGSAEGEDAWVRTVSTIVSPAARSEDRVDSAACPAISATASAIASRLTGPALPFAQPLEFAFLSESALPPPPSHSHFRAKPREERATGPAAGKKVSKTPSTANLMTPPLAAAVSVQQQEDEPMPEVPPRKPLAARKPLTEARPQPAAQHKMQMIDLDEVRDLTRRVPAKRGRKRKEQSVPPDVFGKRPKIPDGIPVLPPSSVLFATAAAMPSQQQQQQPPSQLLAQLPRPAAIVTSAAPQSFVLVQPQQQAIRPPAVPGFGLGPVLQQIHQRSSAQRQQAQLAQSSRPAPLLGPTSAPQAPLAAAMPPIQAPMPATVPVPMQVVQLPVPMQVVQSSTLSPHPPAPSQPQPQSQLQHKVPNTANQQALQALQTEPANALTPENRAMITKFLTGDKTMPPGDQPVRQIPINADTKSLDDGTMVTEAIFFEINFSTGTWRKFRKRQKK